MIIIIIIIINITIIIIIIIREARHQKWVFVVMLTM